MTSREKKWICCAVALILATEIIIFVSAYIRNYREPPEVYPGNAAAILEENSVLLNQAVEILLNTPEAFYAFREYEEIYTGYTVDWLFSVPRVRDCFSAAEIQLLQETASATQLAHVGMYFPMYGWAQAISLRFRCTDQSQSDLCYICPIEGGTDQSNDTAVAELLEYMTYDWVTYQPADYPNWYLEIRSDTH